MAIKGRDLRVKLVEIVNNQPILRKIAGERSCKLTVKCDNKEVASVDSGIWKEFKAGRLSWQVTASALLTADPKLLRTTMFNRTKVYVTFGNAEGDEGFFYDGRAIITDLELSGEVKGKATYSCTLKGTGALDFTQYGD